MRKISVAKIAPGGYTVAADIVSRSGNTLLCKGDHITPTMGRRLGNWGIDFIYIEEDVVAENAAENVRTNACSPMEIKSELYDIFLGTLNSPHMMKIFNAVYKYKLQKLEGGA